MEEKIKILETKKIEKPKEIKVYEISFLQNGSLKRKEVVKSHNVVKILIYHKEKEAFVLVK